MGQQKIEAAFPQIAAEGYAITSPATSEYNCIAWAATEAGDWWDPSPNSGHYWPAEIPRSLDVGTFRKLYALKGGFADSDTADLEAGFEKVAIFTDNHGDVTHAARLKPDGKWTSKLGDWEDIDHDSLAAVEGVFYGKAVCYMKRPIV